ncbi:DUF262 domain-containing protein [Vibrio cholerae]|nr:DUF262 domain-containing protein [Vibrio cholerae]
MSCIPKTEKLIELIEKFRCGDLLLPDFQRKYTWKPKDDMRALLASFILDYPIGTFLIGEAESNSFRSREPECFEKNKYLESVLHGRNLNKRDCFSETIQQSEPYPALFLYDGQQRLTTIEMLFGDGYFASSLDKKNRPRWFLNLYKFGLKDTRWPEDLHEVSFDEICNDEDGNSYIVCIDYNKNSPAGHPLHPSNREEQELVNYCIRKNDNGFLFPLDCLFDDSIEVVKNNLLSLSVNEILVETNQYKSFKALGLSEEELEEKCKEIKKDINKWIAQFSKMINRIRDYQVPVIKINSNNLARVAGIFEVVNKQGVDLKTFDLLLARSIKPNEETIRDTLQRILKESYENNDWDLSVLLSTNEMRSKGYSWDPSQFFGGPTGKVNTGEYLTNSITSLYSKLLCLMVRYNKIDQIIEKTPNSDFNNSNYTWSISEKEILKTDREDIFSVQEDSAIRLVRSCVYLKACCGVIKLSELAYQQIILVLAVIMDDGVWNKLLIDSNGTVAKRIQAWYWVSIFSGSYKRSQDIMALKDSLHVSDFINNGGDYLDERFKYLFKDLGYSDKETLLTGNNKAMLSFILQFEIKDGIRDFYSKDPNGGEYCKEPISAFDSDVEKDHIISLSYYNKASNQNIKRNEGHIVNSPLNKTNISSGANKRKGESSPLEYYKLEEVKSNPTGDEAKTIRQHLMAPEFLLNMKNLENIDDLLNKVVETRFSSLTHSVDMLFKQAR